jgi:hypothetical protein
VLGWFRKRQLSVGKVLYGAAYKVLYERLDPDGCVDDDRHLALVAATGEVLAWAATQAQDVRDAYRKAAKDVVARAETTLENNRRARQMTAAMRTMPKPPGSPPGSNVRNLRPAG